MTSRDPGIEPDGVWMLTLNVSGVDSDTCALSGAPMFPPTVTSNPAASSIRRSSRPAGAPPRRSCGTSPSRSSTATSRDTNPIRSPSAALTFRPVSMRSRATFGGIDRIIGMVIWYGNIAEETHWMRLRLMGVWKPISLMVVFMMFVLPFFGLLSRYTKVHLRWFILFAVTSLTGLWLHRYVEIYPSIYEVAPTLPLGAWELAMAVGLIGVWGLCYIAFMEAFPRVRVTLMTSPYRDQVQVPYDPKTMAPLPAHE